MTQRHACPPSRWLVPARVLALVAVTALSVDIAHQSALADPPDPNDPVVVNLTSEATRPLGIPAPPQNMLGAVQPILSDDFDANGDGSRDMFLIAVPDEFGGLARVAVFSTATQELLWDVWAEQLGDVFPLAATAGDVNSDGKDDVIIAVMRWDEAAQVMESFVDIRSGANGALLHRLSSPASLTDGFGISAAAAGDVNSDGNDDIIVGAPFGGKTGVGRTYVFSGLDGALIHILSPVMLGDSVRFGASVAGVGDVDGDGRADYAVGAPAGAQGAGFVRVYSGSTGAALQTLTVPTPDGEYGGHIAALGDITGDGVAELVVAEPALVLDEDENGAPLRQGRVHVYSGADGQSLTTLEGDSGYVFGASLSSSTRDRNLDGFGDLWVGASSLQNPMDASVSILASYSGPSLTPVFSTTLGDMASGTSFTQPLIGDINSDGAVGEQDIALLLGDIRGAEASGQPAGDINYDGVVDVTDLTLLIEHYGETLPVVTCGAAAEVGAVVYGLGIWVCGWVAAGCYLGGGGRALCLDCLRYWLQQGGVGIAGGVGVACLGILVWP